MPRVEVLQILEITNDKDVARFIRFKANLAFDYSSSLNKNDLDDDEIPEDIEMVYSKFHIGSKLRLVPLSSVLRENEKDERFSGFEARLSSFMTNDLRRAQLIDRKLKVTYGGDDTVHSSHFLS
jgi:hypothetical protein